MAYKALYREWRPLTFNDVVEQEHVTRTLKKSVMAKRVAHAYLFAGTRGTGKTTMALILARAVNCLNPKNGNPCNKCSMCVGILNQTIMDVIEIDAASNNSVENIRNIRDEVVYTPSVTKFKVYIIDEVHMLSSGAFNALLKTLEEPPSHVIFILATTEPHKLPATILSRCQRFDFHRISIDGICRRLSEIMKDSDIVLEDRANKMIARIADGAMRNAINLLDQCISIDSKIITVKEVLECAGIPNDMAMEKLAAAVFSKDVSKVLEIVSKVLMEGKSPSQLLQSIILYFRNLLLCKILSNPEEYIECTSDDLGRMKSLVANASADLITYVIKELSKADSVIKRVSQPRTFLEVVLINICTLNISHIEEISMLERINALERKISNIKQIKVPDREPAPVIRKTQIIEEPQIPEIKNSIQSLDWEKVIKVITDADHIDIYPFLLESSAEIRDNQLVITLKSDFNKSMILSSKENLEHISDAIKQITNNEYILTFNVSSKESTQEGEDSFEELTRKIAEEYGANLEFED
ncbi:MAG: DNA polymerase III subunit gamma/tau [Clostridia bacterium]|nr:DNA polymerase III subunit gamma/tau [Clostridia bacterium]